MVVAEGVRTHEHIGGRRNVEIGVWETQVPKRSHYQYSVHLSPSPSVGRSVCVSRKYGTVAKWLIGSGCRWGRSGMGVLDRVVIVEGEGAVFRGEFEASHCNQSVA